MQSIVNTKIFISDEPNNDNNKKKIIYYSVNMLNITI